jgi:alpha-1,6-mannosyltransferase
VQNSSFKTVHLTNYYHKNSGGISTSYNALLAAAGRHKRLMRLIVPGESESVEIVNDFAKIYYVPAKQSPVFDKRYRILMPWQYMPTGSIIRKILLEEMPDLIEVTDKYTLSMIGAMIRLGKFREIGRPALVHFSCERMDDNIASFLSRGKIGKWLARRLMANYNLPSFDYHIANSPYTAEEFFQSTKKSENPHRSDWFFDKCWRFFKAPRVLLEQRIFVCPRGVDIEQFSPDRKSESVRKEMIAKAKIPENACILLYAGRISPEKNIELLPEFMKILAQDKKDYRLLIAGAGPKEEWLKEQTEKFLPGKIVQFGHLDKETLANYYANVDVFVHPNPREPFGIAPLEAMASGVPTVAPNAGGLLSYATNDSMWLCEPNAEEFAAAIREIVGDTEIREKKIKNALVTAANNSRDKSTDFLFETYDKIYEDFQSRNDLYTNADKPAKMNYADQFSGKLDSK